MDDFSEQQIKTLKAIMDDRLIVNNEKLKQEIKDSSRNTQELLMQEIRASEYRIKTELRKEISDSKDEVIHFIDGQLLPQIDHLDQRVTKLEQKTA